MIQKLSREWRGPYYDLRWIFIPLKKNRYIPKQWASALRGCNDDGRPMSVSRMASQGVNIKIADNADLGYSSKSVSPESIQNRQDRSQKDGDFESMETSSMQIQVDSNQVEVRGQFIPILFLFFSFRDWLMYWTNNNMWNDQKI